MSRKVFWIFCNQIIQNSSATERGFCTLFLKTRIFENVEYETCLRENQIMLFLYYIVLSRVLSIPQAEIYVRLRVNPIRLRHYHNYVRHKSFSLKYDYKTYNFDTMYFWSTKHFWVIRNLWNSRNFYYFGNFWLYRNFWPLKIFCFRGFHRFSSVKNL